MTQLEETENGFAVETSSSERVHTNAVIAATKNEVGYLTGVEGVGIIERGKFYVDMDECGRTGVDGLYAAGRLAEKPHRQSSVRATAQQSPSQFSRTTTGRSTTTGSLQMAAVTDRGRDLLSGCEDIDEGERSEREARSLEVIQEHFAEPHPDAQETHPSLEE